MQITDDLVERACEVFGGITSPDWDSAADWEKEQVREHMHTALEAVLASPAVVALQARAWDQGYRAGVRYSRSRF